MKRVTFLVSFSVLNFILSSSAKNNLIFIHTWFLHKKLFYPKSHCFNKVSPILYLSHGWISFTDIFIPHKIIHGITLRTVLLCIYLPFCLYYYRLLHIRPISSCSRFLNKVNQLWKTCFLNQFLLLLFLDHQLFWLDFFVDSTTTKTNRARDWDLCLCHRTWYKMLAQKTWLDNSSNEKK